MKKSKIMLSVIMAAGIITGIYHTNAYAKVSSYVLKDTVSNKLYEYDIKDIKSNINSPLFFEFMNNFRNSDKVLIHDDETGKYVNYEEINKTLHNKNQKIDIDKICERGDSEKAPFYVYHRINKNGKIENQLNFTKNNVEIDFDIFQLKESNNIRISGNNFNISNFKTNHEIIITPSKNGVVTLNNVTAKNIKVIGTGLNKIKFINVKADTLQIDGNGKLIIDGKFKEIRANKKCEVKLSKNTIIDKLCASDKVVITGNSNAKIQNLIGEKNVKNKANIKIFKTDTVTSESKHDEVKHTGEESKPSSSSTSEKHEQKADVVTSASKHDEVKHTGEQSKPSISSSSEKHEQKPNVVTSTSKKDISNNLQVVDKQRTCIMNIHYVNYAIIVLQEGSYEDYDFYIDDKKVNVQRVNKEGSVVKVELNNTENKRLTIQKGNENEEITLVYKQF